MTSVSDPGLIMSPNLLAAVGAACGLYIILMMVIMCLIMYSKQRKKAYLLFVGAGILIMTYEGMNLYSTTAQAIMEQMDTYKELLEAAALLIINTAVFQLYRRVTRAEFLMFSVMALVLVLPSAVWAAGLLPVYVHASSLMLFSMIYRLIIVVLSVLFVLPRIGQRKKYAAGLLIYTAWIICELWPELRAGAFGLTSSFLPLLYYSTLFFILFERIVELLQRIYRSSITDGLTGLYNRRYFSSRLKRYTEQGVRISVIFCDIDNFKKLNDTQGHTRADDVLKQVALIMEEEVAPIGLTGRYGGEELVALIVDKRAKVNTVAERIRSRVANESIVTISIGHSTLKRDISPEELVKQADQAMYVSKTTGKNKVTAYRAAEVRKSLAARAQ